MKCRGNRTPNGRAGSRTRAELQSGRRSRRSLGKIRARCEGRILRKRQRGDRLQQGRGRRRGQLRRGLVAQVAVGAMRVITPSLMMPVADHAGREDQQRDEGQYNTQDLERFTQFGFGPGRKLYS